MASFSSPHLISSLILLLSIFPYLCSSSSVSVSHPEKQLVKRPVPIVPKAEQPLCDVKYGSPTATACRFAIAEIYVDHSNPSRVRNWQLGHFLPFGDTTSIRIPVTYKVRQCIIRIDLRDYRDNESATWAEVKTEIQTIQQKCVKERSLGGMATVGVRNRLWVSIYNVGSYIDALQTKAQRHGMIAGTLAALGDTSVLDECKLSEPNEAPGLGPGSLYDYEDPGAWELPLGTAEVGFNAYCLEAEDCGCGVCKGVEVKGKGLLMGIVETVGVAIGACQSEIDFG